MSKDGGETDFRLNFRPKQENINQYKCAGAINLKDFFAVSGISCTDSCDHVNKYRLPQHTMDNTLLDPRNDLVFKLLFTRSLPLLSDLINAVRSTEPPVTVVSIHDPLLAPDDINRKFIILDILATDADGHFYNIEMQMSRQQS